MKNRSIILVFLFIALFSTGAFFWHLSDSAIANADEGVHALVTREIRERPDWITMHIRGGTYFRKPPLSFWIRAATQVAFGENELTTRLPSALAGIATTMLLAVWAWQWTRKWQTTLVVGLIYPLLPSTFLHTFRTGETDGVLLFLLTLTAFLLWKTEKRPGLIIAAGATTGLAFMTKSVAAGVVPIAFVVALLLTRRWMFTLKQVVVAVAAFVIVAAPWHIAESVRHGSTFWGEYIGYHVIERVEEKLHVTPKTHGPFWYLIAVENGMYPWSWLVVPALALGVVRARRRDELAFGEMFLLTWSVGTVVLFSLAQTKLAWYVAPAFPPLTLLIGRFLTERWRSMSWSIAALAIVGFAAYGYMTTRDYTTGVAGLASLSFLPAIVVAVVFAVLAWWSRFGKRWGSLLAGLLVFHMAFFAVVVYSRNARKIYESPFRIFRNEIVQRDAKAKVFIFPIGYITSPLSAIYLEGPQATRVVTALRENTDDLKAVVGTEHGSFILFDVDHPVPTDLSSSLDEIRRYDDLTLYRVR